MYAIYVRTYMHMELREPLLKTVWTSWLFDYLSKLHTFTRCVLLCTYIARALVMNIATYVHRGIYSII